MSVLIFLVLVFAIIPIISNFDGTLHVNAAEHLCLAEPNGDGKVSASYARLALRNSVKLETFKDYQSAAADMDAPSKENSVTASDARFILRTSVGLEKIDEWFKNKLK